MRGRLRVDELEMAPKRRMKDTEKDWSNTADDGRESAKKDSDVDWEVIFDGKCWPQE